MCSKARNRDQKFFFFLAKVLSFYNLLFIQLYFKPSMPSSRVSTVVQSELNFYYITTETLYLIIIIFLFKWVFKSLEGQVFLRGQMSEPKCQNNFKNHYTLMRGLYNVQFKEMKVRWPGGYRNQLLILKRLSVGFDIYAGSHKVLP